MQSIYLNHLYYWTAQENEILNMANVSHNESARVKTYEPGTIYLGLLIINGNNECG